MGLLAFALRLPEAQGALLVFSKAGAQIDHILEPSLQNIDCIIFSAAGYLCALAKYWDEITDRQNIPQKGIPTFVSSLGNGPRQNQNPHPVANCATRVGHPLVP
jgi:hypothetical protein